MQMRFPMQPMTGKEYLSHHMTLLDGELIVSEDRDSGKQTYKYLAYDIMALACNSVVQKPWKVCALLRVLIPRLLDPLKPPSSASIMI